MVILSDMVQRKEPHKQVLPTIYTHAMLGEQPAGAIPVLLMVSGGSDSTALACIFAELAQNAASLNLPEMALGVVHINHCTRGNDSDADTAFVQALCNWLALPLFLTRIDVPALCANTGENFEAAAREQRYIAAKKAVEQLCERTGAPYESARVCSAHTADDRIENFYMRSIVGTGPGGLRSMDYITHRCDGLTVCHPLLDCTREELRTYLRARAKDASFPLSAAGLPWCEDNTNNDTNYFRAYVRHAIVPAAKKRNAQLEHTLTRTMNLIAEENDYVSALAKEHAATTTRIHLAERTLMLHPSFGTVARVLQKRIIYTALKNLMGPEARIETATIEAILAAFTKEGTPISGYVTNIQGNFAVSANKRGVLIEPMERFRARRKKK